MYANILIVEDDNNLAEALKEFFMESDSSQELVVHAVRTVEEAEAWIGSKSRKDHLKVCILDLMFPPKTGEVSGDIADLAQGIGFYENHLKNRFKTVILTGALRWTRAENAISEMIKEDKGTVLIKKPSDFDHIEELLIDLLRNDNQGQ
jgi:DNA-binding NtrC family response regulator